MTSLPILNYHALDNSRSAISTSPTWFDQTLRTLHTEGFQCVDLETWISAGRPAIERGFALTFDDGLASILRGSDAIVRHGFTATVFIVTGRIGLDNGWNGQPSNIPVSPLLDTKDLDELQSAGLRLGAHSISHPHFNSLAIDDMKREIVGSRLAIEHLTGKPCRLFAYPYGEAPPAARELVAREFTSGFGTRLAYANSHEDRTRISRVDAFYLRTPSALRSLVGGSWPKYLALRRAARTARRAFAIA